MSSATVKGQSIHSRVKSYDIGSVLRNLSFDRLPDGATLAQQEQSIDLPVNASIPRKPCPTSPPATISKHCMSGNAVGESFTAATPFKLDENHRRRPDNAAPTMNTTSQLSRNLIMEVGASRPASDKPTGYRKRSVGTNELSASVNTFSTTSEDEIPAVPTLAAIETSIPRGSFEDPFVSGTHNGSAQKEGPVRMASISRVTRAWPSSIASSGRNSMTYFPAGSVKEVKVKPAESPPPEEWATKSIRLVAPSTEKVNEGQGLAKEEGDYTGLGTHDPSSRVHLSPEGNGIEQIHYATHSGQRADWPETRPLDAGASSNEGSSPVVTRQQPVRNGYASDEKRTSRFLRHIYDAGGDTENESRDSADSSPIRESDVRGWGAYSTSSLAQMSRPGEPTARDALETRALGLNGVKEPASPDSSNRNSKVLREPLELAGGVEDWSGVQEGDVDRFGFIRTRKALKRVSAPMPSTITPHSSPPVSPRMSSTPSLDIKRSHLQLPKSRGSLRSSRSLLGMRSTSGGMLALRSARTRELVEAQSMLSPDIPEMDTADDSAIGELTDIRSRGELQARREQKWRKMGTRSGGPMVPAGRGKPVLISEVTYKFDVHHAKLISRVWKGIPDSMRGPAWYSFLDTAATKHSSTVNPQPTEDELIARFYALQSIDYTDDGQIDLDVPRTIGAHICFRRRYRGGQRMLFRLLHALALHFPDIGYVQGMAPIAATLLVYFEEEKAFVAAVRLWMYKGIAWLYGNGFEGLMNTLEEFETKWMKKQGEPLFDISKKLDDLGVIGMTWATKWYLTLFQYALPYEAHLRVLDVFVLLSDSAGPKRKPNVDVLHSVAAALLLGMREQILARDAQFEDAMSLLTNKINLMGSEDGAEGGKGMDALLNVAKTEYNRRTRY